MNGDLRIEGISSGYGKRIVLSDVSFKAERGEITSIIGPNGCGKSTLLKTLAGLIPLSAGKIFYGENDSSLLDKSERARRVSYLSQNRNTPDITVSSLVLHGRFPYISYPRRYSREDYIRVDEVLSKMGLSDKKDKRVSDLSGGERQKVYIAMCLVQDTDVLLFDEPTTFLDVSRQFSFLDEAKALRDEGKTIVMVLHDIPQALEESDRIVVLSGGRVMGEGDRDEVFSSGIVEDIFGVSLSRDGNRFWVERK
ncbi:MAG: ABC transporter ATP-binding protein [Candidatus Ornithospirochaeta sp.]